MSESHGKQILDMCCGSKMFWFDRNDNRVVFCDIRTEDTSLCDGRAFKVDPDVIADFRSLPFSDEEFSLVVFDPPHLHTAGDSSWLKMKYGKLDKSTYRDDLKMGFDEAWRVLRRGGSLIFKWNEVQIKTSEIIGLCGLKPAFGHPSGKRADTHWICFYKDL
jgi:SAM-dependent methyltransferase